MAKTLLIDGSKCTGCRLCETVCSVTRTGKVNPCLSQIRIVRLDRADKPYLPVVHGQSVASLSDTHTEPDLASVLKGFMLLPSCDCCEGDPECVKACEAGVLRYEELVNDSMGSSEEKGLGEGDTHL
jgi:carbon-monoxide dehydrogenase iron sulfur subunit